MVTQKITQQTVKKFLKEIKLPQADSHKGQNGKLLIIGGSHLFHAASRWSLDIASKFVDMVFYSSVPANNNLIHEAKQNFWNGIVIPREEVENYAQEADCILIGPGMERHEPDVDPQAQDKQFYLDNPPDKQEWQTHTEKVTNYLLAKFADKKLVIDAGALQMLNPALLTPRCILTPHHKELEMLVQKVENEQKIESEWYLGKIQQQEKSEQKKEWTAEELVQISQQLQQTTILLKGRVDQVVYQDRVYEVGGGNAGMTKGGTGDVLAGLAAGLYTTNQAEISALVASYVNKAAGELLFKDVGPFYNASDLVGAIPQVMWEEMS